MFASRSRLEATCRPRRQYQGKGKSTSRPCKNDAVFWFSLRCQWFCQSFICDGCLSPLSTSCRENKWCEYCILHLPYPVSIFPLLCILLLPVECWDLCVSVARCVWVKDPNVKKCIFLLISTLASSCLLADLGSIVSPVSGYNFSSFSTYVHTSVSHLVVISLISLCLDIGSGP